MNDDVHAQLRAKPSFTVGDRVFVKRIRPRGGTELGGWYGTVLALPPELGGPNGVPAGLYAVLSDDGELHGLAPELLEKCGDAEARDGLKIAAQRLHEKRQALRESIVRIVASCRQLDVADPKVDAEVKQMTASWAGADLVRRKGFRGNTELRLLITKYIELGELIEQIGELQLIAKAADEPQVARGLYAKGAGSCR